MGMIIVPGPRKPNTIQTQRFNIEVSTDNGVEHWRPFGPYQYARFQWAWNMPAVAEIRIPISHPMAQHIVAVRRRTISIRTEYNGIPWDGRVMTFSCKGKPGQEIVTAYCINNWVWLQSMLAWPQPLFPRAEFQAPKHDIGFGPLDGVAKYFIAKNATRLQVPVYAKLPIQADIPDLPDLNDISSLDALLDYMADSTEDLIAVWARMTRMDEVFKTHLANSDRALTVSLYRHGIDPDPGSVFNADSLGHLENIISWEGLQNFFYFLNPGNLLGLANPDNWLTAQKTCYVVDTVQKRDRRHMQWRVDGGNVVDYERAGSTPEGWQVIVGGKAPEILNQAIEIGINALIGAAMSALQIGGVAPAVGDIFNDLFFAFSQFTDPDLKAVMGPHGLAEGFANSSTAFSLDALAAGTQKLKEIGGQDTIRITVRAGQGGYSFGKDIDDGTRFQLGDIMTCEHLGTTIEQHVNTVEVTDDPRTLLTESITLGDDLKLRSAWDRVIGKIGELAGGVNAAAVASN